MPRPKVCVLRTAGTNCDQETAFAFSKADSDVELVHINSLIRRQKDLDDYQILAIPGGFTYGDDVAAGKILANELRYKLIQDLKDFIGKGKLIIGICNGFQALVKSGLLPGNAELTPMVSLTINDSGKFEDRWVYLKKFKSQNSKQKDRCVWTKELPGMIYLPVAHGEGKFVTLDRRVLKELKNNGQVVMQYCDQEGSLAGYPHNPNGSQDNIAGICDETGRIFGLMPHPERHVHYLQHPKQKIKKYGDGIQIFRNGVEYVRKNSGRLV